LQAQPAPCDSAVNRIGSTFGLHVRFRSDPRDDSCYRLDPTLGNRPHAVDRPAGRSYARPVKLSDRKIAALADKITRWMEGQPDVEFLVERTAILDAIIAEFQAEKERERKLDEEVERILEQNTQRMRAEGVDPWLMRKKVRQQLARERGMVL
jgi:hypothetical protein